MLLDRVCQHDVTRFESANVFTSYGFQKHLIVKGIKSNEFYATLSTQDKLMDLFNLMTPFPESMKRMMLYLFATYVVIIPNTFMISRD